MLREGIRPTRGDRLLRDAVEEPVSPLELLHRGGEVRHRRGGPQDRHAPVLGREGVRQRRRARHGVPRRGEHVPVLPTLQLEGGLNGVARLPGRRVQEVEGEILRISN